LSAVIFWTVFALAASRPRRCSARPATSDSSRRTCRAWRCAGSLSDPQSLDAALRDVTHVIHCAGCTKALRNSEFYEVNQAGTRNVVEAVNRQQGRIQRLVHLSSLAAGGPASPDQPAREDDLPHPVSEYGRSKLAGEREVQDACKTEYVILRPPAVYGPRDEAFLPLFKAVKRTFCRASAAAGRH
jgi:dihydroflavonol-4-reductase